MSSTQKLKTLYVCTSCDAQSPKWSGQCFECQSWGTLEESAVPGAQGSSSPTQRKVAPSTVAPLADVRTSSYPRVVTGIGELDRVLGGGIVPGSAILLGGEPGIGKSTLALMIAASVATKTKKSSLYVSGEESASQVKSRACCP